MEWIARDAFVQSFGLRCFPKILINPRTKLQLICRQIDRCATQSSYGASPPSRSGMHG